MRCLSMSCVWMWFVIGCGDSSDGGHDTPFADVHETTGAEVDSAPDAADTTGVGRALTRHDVSVLFPLPTSGDPLWPATTEGRGGQLVTRAEFDRIGRSLTLVLPDAEEYAALRVVAARFDPCFRMALTSACQPQVRLVLQAVDVEDGAYDGALHALYNLSSADWGSLETELRELAEATPENDVATPLGVSPALEAQGLDGAYAQGLRVLVTRYAGPATLARLTFMTRTNSRTGQWEFGGSHIGTWPGTDFPAPGAIFILGSDKTLQTVTRPVGMGFNYSVDPAFSDALGHPGVSSATLDELGTEARAEVFAWTQRQEGPAATVADTTDCASCHLAGRIARHLEALEPSFVTSEIAAARGPRVIGAAEGNGDNLRAFGWFAQSPQISQRVANETEAVVRALAGAR